ncbi:MAG: hypothetical protein ACI9K2_006710 [Myxococcota bacterium]|jgi:hypothetical protein
MRRWVVLAALMLGCEEGGDKPVDTSDTAGPCVGLDLPACPGECPDDWQIDCGEACSSEGQACGNNIGDGRTCTGGVWECSVHAPLDPDGCNLVGQ